MQRNPLFTAWKHLSRLGTASQPMQEQRRIRICNQGAVIGALTTLGFATGYLAGGVAVFWTGIVANLGGAAAMVFTLLLNARGRHDLARVVFFSAVNLTALTASILFGPGAGFYYYFFVIAPIPFLIVPRRSRWTLRLFPVLSVVCFIYIQYFCGPEDVTVRLAPETLKAIHIVSVLLTHATLIFVLYLFHMDLTRTEERLAEEHERSERLLLNVLPVSISQRLKGGQQSFADAFDEVTVLFADLVGFTELSARLSPEQLVDLLNRIFSAFDELCDKHGLEKIKTIGDCYMVAAGLPVARPDHARAIARMALAMRSALGVLNRETGHRLDLRIGIHSGRVVAGVIGKKKFIYDLWGDTVNTASRMESHGIAGEIQVTADVKRLIESEFELAARGTITVKGKGEMDTFLLVAEKT